MYIIYMLLSMLGIAAPYSNTESRNGSAAYQNTAQVATDMLENYHARSETICLTTGNKACDGGQVQQPQEAGTEKAFYGTGIISVSNGKDSVVTFMPQSTSYRFNPERIKGDVYRNLINVTGNGLNAGYYDQKSNSIILKNGTSEALPDGMNAYRLYDHMPILVTSLKGSPAALSRGANAGTGSDLSVMNNLRSEGSGTEAGVTDSTRTTTCADGSTGTVFFDRVSRDHVICGSGSNVIPSATNNQASSAASNQRNGNSSGSGTDSNFGNDSDLDESGGSGPIAISNSTDGTMYMGEKKTTSSSSSADDSLPSDNDSDNQVNLNQGDSVPVGSNLIPDCRNIMYPLPDSSASSLNSYGYSYQYDFYIDVDQCQSFVRPQLDNLSSNFAMYPNQGDVLADLGWVVKNDPYQYFDWFGADDENTGVRNPKSSNWNLSSADCSVNTGIDIYNSSVTDLEAMATQNYSQGMSDNLKNCNTNSVIGGENGSALNSFNYDISNNFNIDGNTGPYFNRSFMMWGVSWLCKADTYERSGNLLHYHLVCVPSISNQSQTNNYTDYNSWKNFRGQYTYPYGGMFSIGHKGSNNLGTTWPDSKESDDSDDLETGFSPSNDYYTGQAIGSYVPFVFNMREYADSSPDGISYLLNQHSNRCVANNPAGATGIVPSGSCENLMNGILLARNRSFFNYTQKLLEDLSNRMKSDPSIKGYTSSLDGTGYSGTAGVPQQDSDGVWRWHLADLQAPSFGTPSGTLLTTNSAASSAKQGDYFTYYATIPADGIYGTSVNNANTGSVPSFVGFGNGQSVSVAGSSNTNTISTNGYGYSCQLGDYQGFDSSSGQLKYAVNCSLNGVPGPVSQGGSSNQDNNVYVPVSCDDIIPYRGDEQKSTCLVYSGGIFFHGKIEYNDNGKTRYEKIVSTEKNTINGDTSFYDLSDGNFVGIVSNGAIRMVGGKTYSIINNGVIFPISSDEWKDKNYVDINYNDISFQVYSCEDSGFNSGCKYTIRSYYDIIKNSIYAEIRCDSSQFLSGGGDDSSITIVSKNGNVIQSTKNASGIRLYSGHFLNDVPPYFSTAGYYQFPP